MTSPTDSRLLVTGGAGFVGANLALGLRSRHPEWEIVALDNLKRRGSELNLRRLRDAGVRFMHGDVREPADLEALDRVDAVIECSAEPSALAGFEGAPDYPLRTNLLGAYHCLELARRHDAHFVFLSTSRVYPIGGLSELRLRETETRFELDDEQDGAGISAHGVAEDFPLDGARTLYGTTKLAAELLIDEYADAFGLRATVDRCGVIAGPWQMGKVDQGVFTYWMLAHYFRRPVSYIGFGGAGKQVRDLVHVDDLLDLIDDQITRPDHWAGFRANVGGGRDCSLSLLETTRLCAEITGNDLDVGRDPQTRPGDVPLYISDCRRLFQHTDWRPRRTARQVLEDIFTWIRENEAAVEAAVE